MRIYEFAKKHGVSSKQVMDILKKHGSQAKSHMSILSDSDISFLSSSFTPSLKNKEIPLQKEKISISKKVMPDKSKNLNRSVKKNSAFVPKTEPIVQVPAKVLLKPASVLEVANQLQKMPSQVIITLLQWGIVATINQFISEDIIERLAEHYEVEAVAYKQQALEKEVILDDSQLQSRPPVAVILGHVDHGKTTLLDFIRKSKVASKEKGGITQHLGAYEVETDHGKIIFLDTPGHKAFEKIRQRGVHVADIVVLIVAADDGVMPQTVESIKRAKEMAVPLLVAINKADKVDDAQLEVVKRQLAQYDVLVEDWGGEVICLPISAKTGQGVDNLLEMIALQSEMLELRAGYTGLGRGYILESKIEKGRGSVATVILQNGSLNIGDYFICGSSGGRINLLIDSYFQSKKSVGPAIPIQVFGFDQLPQVGDLLQVVSSKAEYKKHIESFKNDIRLSGAGASQENAFNLIVKADTHSSREALVDSILKLSNEQGGSINVVSSGIGEISEGDVEFAYNTGASVVGLHIKASGKSLLLAARRNVSIELEDIIYKLLDSLKDRVSSMQTIPSERVKTGTAVVLRVFKIKGAGVIAGCKVDSGRFVKGGIIVALRGTEVIGEGKITSLQRDKKSVQSVEAGYECGFVVENISDWAEGDFAECYIEQERK